MATEFSPYSVKRTFEAGADLSTAQYKFVKIDNGTGNVVLCSGTTDSPIGVLQNDPDIGEAAEVMISGGSKLLAGGSASAGEPLFTSASATGVTATIGGAASVFFVTGSFLEAAAAGEVVSVVVDCAKPVRGA